MTARGLADKELADRCAALGQPGLNRSVIANLESGRRGAVSVHELLVLAAALNVAPLHLALPINDDEPYAFTPGRALTAKEARAWFVGELNVAGASTYETEVPAGWTDRHKRQQRDATYEEVLPITVDLMEALHRLARDPLIRDAEGNVIAGNVTAPEQPSEERASGEHQEAS